MAGKQGRRGSGAGHVRKLPSGRWQASYLGPDGRRHTARTPDGGPLTFTAKADADAWLALRRSEILRGAWLPPAEPAPKRARPQTLGEYAAGWLADRELSEGTRRLYRATLGKQILPAFGAVPLTEITPAMVRDWYARLAAADRPAPAFGRLRAAPHDHEYRRRRGRDRGEPVPGPGCRVGEAGQADPPGYARRAGSHRDRHAAAIPADGPAGRVVLAAVRRAGRAAPRRRRRAGTASSASAAAWCAATTAGWSRTRSPRRASVTCRSRRT